MTYIPIEVRVAIRRSLPFQSDFPSCAFGAARRNYAAARRDALAQLRNARTVQGRTYPTYIGETRRYLANLRAARAALLRLEA